VHFLLDNRFRICYGAIKQLNGGKAMRIRNTALLKDVLYNLTNHSGASDEYCKGLMIGIVSTIMAFENISHKDAMRIVAQYLPTAEHYRKIPKFWWEQ